MNKIQEGMILNKRAFSIILLLFSFTSFAQERCGTMMLHELKNGQGSYREQEKVFEEWLSDRIAFKQRVRTFGIQQTEVYEIPVVVHVIHNGEAEGIGGNIPEGQILSQIQILSEDYRRLNADTVNTNPNFVPVAADIGIEFKLAERDPEGLPTNGIVRVQGSQPTFNLAQDEILKSHSFWPTEDYLNIWVADLASGLLGYAQFPVSNIEGLNVDVSNDRLTDGVVIDYRFFGTGFNTDDFSVGRTATHEVGHFLGLRHTWGDGGCSQDDYCADTPPMNGSTPATCPVSRSSCGEETQVENYMDFTPDACMNMFTACQGTRMRTVMENSPRRLSLTTSNGGTPPPSVADDVGIRDILTPEISICNNQFIPQVEIRNYGTNDVTTFEIDVLVNDVVRESVTNNTTLSPLELTTVIFQPIAGTSGATENVSFRITSTNLGSDNNPENDQMSIQVQIPMQADLPLDEDFESFNDNGWLLTNNNGRAPLWEVTNAPNQVANNQAIYLDYVGSESERFGDFDYLISPVFDFSKIESAELNFSYAYASVNGNLTDGLMVGISTDCGQTFDRDDFVFERIGPSLETSTSNGIPFVPTGPSDWDQININLTPFIGESEVRIAFIGQNGSGNTLYIDDIGVEANSLFNFDIAVTDVNRLSLVSCNNNQAPEVVFKNFGTSPVIEVTYEYTVGNMGPFSGTHAGLVLPGGEDVIRLPIINLDRGFGTFDFTALNVNGIADQDPSDNSISRNYIIEDKQETIPLKQNFEVDNLDSLGWFVFAETGESEWELTEVTRGNTSTRSLSVPAYDVGAEGSRSWLVTPNLNLSQLDEASVFFDVSYGWDGVNDDGLTVLVSTNCGEDFEQVVFNKTGENLATENSDDSWEPTEDADWRKEYVDLSDFVGFSQVMVAFVFTNGNGNNFFLDNIEFFISNDSDPVRVEGEPLWVYPNPATYSFVTSFNLPQREDVTITLVDASGKQIFEQEFPNTLNQTYEFITTTERNGTYLLWVKGPTVDFARRVLIWSP